MKIAHICMSAPYIDGWGYQENLLPKYMSEQGVESIVIASNILPAYQNNETVPVGEYYIDKVKVIRIPCVRKGTSLTFSKGLMDVLERECPDAIFHHNLNFPTHVICNKYCMNNKAILFEDNHADDINCIKNRLKGFIFYKCLNGFITKLFSQSIYRFYGVTHSRCDFLIKRYGIPSQKVGFLPIGADVEAAELIKSKETLRKDFCYQATDIIIVSGGKMGIDKGTVDLIEALKDLHEEIPSLKLILFGKFSDSETKSLSKQYDFIQSFGWCDRTKTLELLKMSDLACWPIHHTTLCEDAIACCTPLLIRKTGTTEHLVDGNGFFMSTGNKAELTKYLRLFAEYDSNALNNLKERSVVMRNRISYKTLVNQIIQIVEKNNGKES